MRTRSLLMVLPFFLLVLIPAIAIAAAPQVGQLAPDFEFKGGDGTTVRLADYVPGVVPGVIPGVAPADPTTGVAGEAARPSAAPRGVVIAWFPKAFTPG